MINQPGAPPTPATVSPGEGISGETDPLVAAVCYQAWDWPVTLHGHQVWLTLEPDTLPLPPTTTPHGPLTWVHPPQADALHQWREFEVFAALRTALRDPPT